MTTIQPSLEIRAITDINECARFAEVSQGYESGHIRIDADKWRKWLSSEHSPIRVFDMLITFTGIPYRTAMHFRTHSVGILHSVDVLPIVRSQRPDGYNPVEYDRDLAPQNAPVVMMFKANPQALMAISRKRLCANADIQAQTWWKKAVYEVSVHENPYVAAIADFMVPECEYRGGWCHELRCCGRYPKWQLEKFRTQLQKKEQSQS